MLARRLLPPLALFLAPPLASAAIDREALVHRHDIHVTKVDPEAALTVGNGDFAFTVDVTGLQSIENLYYKDGIPLETLSTWAWHSHPNVDHLKLTDAMAPSDFHGRPVPYASLQDSPAGKYFRENPHPLALGQISLVYKGQPITPELLSAIDQKLDLWTGVVRSTYQLAGQPVIVETAAHASQSVIAARIESPLLANGELQVRIRFSYSHDVAVKNKPPLVWDKPDRHQTKLTRSAQGGAQFARTVDDATYFANLQWEGPATLTEAAVHDFRLAASTNTLAFTCAFSPSRSATTQPTFAATRAASAQGWKDYWTKGGAIDLSAATDPRAPELERRIVLSQYILRVNYSGSVPPAESGLTHLSWYGKHNSEMYFWHAAQFYIWGHVDLLEKGLGWYREILPSALADAKAQGFSGARWPKMAGIDGRPGPGTINPFIIWNQPNPIYLSELVYRAKPTKETLERYRDVVFESANFLVSFAWLDPQTQHYVLGPPVKNVSESTGENNTRNPTFELAYWHYGLTLAQEWRKRLGLAADPKWADVLAKLTPLPVADGKYLEMETYPELYKRASGGLPTTMLLALGFLPKTDMVDTETMRRTFDEVNRRSRNGVGRWVSWSQGQGAMTAARLGQTENALAIILNPTARYMPNGLVRRPAEPFDCPAFIPVNASLLAAAGLMAGGWDGAPAGELPGFPKDPKWKIAAEGLQRMP